MKDLLLKNVSFSYPDNSLAVDNINLSIKGGKNVAIIGQNGAGKTTTVKMMNGLLKPTSGDVIIGDVNTKDRTTAQISRFVGYVFQNPDDQIFHSTVRAEVAFGPKTMKLDEAEIKKRVDAALEMTGLTKWGEENPYNLPLSIRKFVTMAAVVAMNTEILIFDEPTAGQDESGNERLSKILRALHEMGKTVITISHDMEFVVSNFTDVIVMANKKVIKVGKPEEIFWDFDTLSQANLKMPIVSDICRSLNIGSGIINMDDAVAAIMKEIKQ
jgi:energy-coupling factor transport system ATP-binding protein